MMMELDTQRILQDKKLMKEFEPNCTPDYI